MTRDNRRKNIAAEIARGDEALQSAALLIDAGLLADGIGRAYYAAFHYARALLLTEGEEARSHGGVDRLVQRDFVRTGQLAPEVARLLSRLQGYRQDADYTAEYVFTEATAREELDGARRYVAATRKLLEDSGWLGEPPSR